MASDNQVEMEKFQLHKSETKALENLKQVLFNYVIQKEACSPEKLLVDVKTFCGMSLPDIPKAECSNVIYLSVLDLHADTPEAIKKVVEKLQEEYMVGVNVKYLVWWGIKRHVRIRELKHEYQSALDWLIPFIGDWHLLSNYQSLILCRIYPCMCPCVVGYGS